MLENMNTENEKFEYGLAHDNSDEQKITGLDQLSDPLPFVIAEPEPKKKKPHLIIVGYVGHGSTVATQLADVQKKNVVVAIEDFKEVEQKSTIESLKEATYTITKLPELDPIYLAKPINKKKNWYEGKHKKHRK
jgi:hypothetical protein